MDLVPEYRNYRHWENHLKLGATFKNVFLRNPHMVDADCPAEFVMIDEKIKEQSKLI